MSLNILKDANYWGGGCWKFLHCVSLTYDGQDYQEVSNMLKSVIKMLPCDSCRDHSTEFIKDWTRNSDGAFLVNSKNELERFVNDLHNHANVKSGKDIPYIDLEASKEMMLKSYKDFHLRSILKKDYVIWIILMISSSIVFIILYKMNGFWRNYRKTNQSP